ncbi:MAG: NAD(+) synthase [Planctomycetaceae bacterium]|nr:NAD(+) synthase [Planctomycetaceae bacterium]
MFNGFIRVAAASPAIRVADPHGNSEAIVTVMREAEAEGVQLLCLPELCLTGYTCGDLFHQRPLLRGAMDGLESIRKASERHAIVVVVGMPLSVDGKLYNTAVVVQDGRVLGVVPKTHLPGYGEFYEPRHFTPAPAATSTVALPGGDAPFGTRLLFQCDGMPDFCLAVEICEDLWVPNPPSVGHAMNGATIILNLSASDETVGKAGYRRELVTGQSARLLCGYVYADAGQGESSTDMVFAGHHLVGENGALLAESPPFDSRMAVAEIDLHGLAHDRRRLNTFAMNHRSDYTVIPFAKPPRPAELRRRVDPAPFVPSNPQERSQRCEDILSIQATGLATRLHHTGGRAVLGISGGLDSCLALLVTRRACALVGQEAGSILAVTMPCFGTTGRTKGNAIRLCEALGVDCRTIDIHDQVEAHFRAIGHDPANRDVVYENAQARIRTLHLMDLANGIGGLVVGTGDLSELALGWATYNGDHMSMYAVNAGVPKTLVRHLVRHVADTCGDEALRAVLVDILDTPVSPELLPPDGDDIAQKTEDLVGPYELHDFFLYHVIRRGRTPRQMFALACEAFGDKFEPEVVRCWLKVFIRRFFAQQFKRSCLPDGPKIGSVTLSPRADWRMPSDAAPDAWLREVEEMEGGR